MKRIANPLKSLFTITNFLLLERIIWRYFLYNSTFAPAGQKGARQKAFGRILASYVKGVSEILSAADTRALATQWRRIVCHRQQARHHAD